MDKYPRVVLAVDVELERVVSLVQKTRNPPLASIRANSLDDDLRYSQGVGQFLADTGVQGLLFKSSVGTNINLLVFLDNCGPDQLKVRKLDEIFDTLNQIVRTHKP